jgi:hypothetical protein
MKNDDLKNNTPTDANNVLANVISSGSKLVFTDEFKQKIIDHPSRDVMYYIRNDVFEVKEVKDDKVSIKGIAMLGFVPISLFNVC